MGPGEGLCLPSGTETAARGPGRLSARTRYNEGAAAPVTEPPEPLGRRPDVGREGLRSVVGRLDQGRWPWPLPPGSAGGPCSSLVGFAWSLALLLPLAFAAPPVGARGVP